MTRSKERLRAGAERVETGRARLRKHVVTDTGQVQVSVSREEVRVEREPITDANRQQRGGLACATMPMCGHLAHRPRQRVRRLPSRPVNTGYEPPELR